MSVLIPVLLWLGLVALWLVIPQRPVRQARKRSRDTAAALAARTGTVPAPDAVATPWPGRAAPFHYGTGRRREGSARGELAGHASLSYAFCCVDNGVAHWSNVLELRLSEESTALEVYHEPPYTSFKVPLPTTLEVQLTGDRAVDRVWQVRYDVAAPQDRELARVLVSHLREAPEAFSLRAQGDTLVVWRDGGFASASSAEKCASVALAAVAAFSERLPAPAVA